MEQEEKPAGDLTTRCVAMPADTNPEGDIFGGWVLSQMDLAGGVACKRKTSGRTVTAAVDKMSFYLPVMVGDILCCYVEVLKIGNSSIQTKIEAWVEREYDLQRLKVTEGIFTYVAVDSTRRPRKINLK